MYRISELAEKVGVSRSTLLYYEKLGLIASKRRPNGYRVYSDQDLEQLRLLQQLQVGGLTLKECLACLTERVDRSVLLRRLQALDDAIAAKQRSRDLLASMLGMSSLRVWHQTLESQAPGAHLAWLMKQGFSEKQALRLKWLSKDMHEHDRYMTDFDRIFAGLDRLGPGSQADTLRAFRALPAVPDTLLEIGCGRGATTLLLADWMSGPIVALDNDAPSLVCLSEALEARGWQRRVTPLCASMTELPFGRHSFDTIWAEGSAYIMGFEAALAGWKPLIRPRGTLVVSDLVWLTDTPPEPAAAFWRDAYPGMATVADRLATIAALGYRVLTTFALGAQAWDNYLEPLRDRVAALAGQRFASNALADIKKELDVHRRHLGAYGYQTFVLQVDDGSRGESS